LSAANARKSVFITGAASGMGRATALLFAECGWFVGGFDVDIAGLNTLKSEIGEANGVFERLDVTDSAAFAATMAQFGSATDGKLDLMFSNAGIGNGGLFDEQPWDEVMRIVNVNFIGG
jgi:NAD(P)-dependent dehydrogenase (short-subunit alcohol dehydrogenase family)